MAKNLTLAVIIFLYFRAISGLVIIFYPFQPDYLRLILSTIGALIVLTSGLEIKFSHLLRPTIKPNK